MGSCLQEVNLHFETSYQAAVVRMRPANSGDTPDPPLEEGLVLEHYGINAA